MPHLLNIWPAISRQLSSPSRILLLLDYDGTLAPIVARPEVARLPDEARRCLQELAQEERFKVGVVSGRKLTELEELIAIPGLVYAGNHGLEIRGLGMDFVHPEASGFIGSLTKVARLLNQELEYVPKLLVHDKNLTLSVHFWNTPDSYSTEIDQMVRSVVNPYALAGELKITRGKKVIEIRPNIDWGKGEAIKKIQLECVDNPIPMFFGDDQTDEDGFAVVQSSGGFAVYIGPPRQETQALHQLESPAEVAQVLALLVALDS